MRGMEKVIKALQSCSVQNDVGCQGCPYFEERKTYGHEWCTTSMAQDALPLLKEQKTKKGYWINPTSQDCHCSECGEQPVHETGESVPLYDFCPYCGAKMEVKWNEQP